MGCLSCSRLSCADYVRSVSQHRDLHWGNLLLQPTSHARRAHPRLSDAELADETTSAIRSLNFVSSTVPLSPALSGITATLIDFTLSRCTIDAEGEAVFDPFEDGEIFEGTGDEQFDVYRRMREVVETEGGDWAAAHPRTNVLVSALFGPFSLRLWVTNSARPISLSGCTTSSENCSWPRGSNRLPRRLRLARRPTAPVPSLPRASSPSPADTH
mgnify:FL=1